MSFLNIRPVVTTPSASNAAHADRALVEPLERAVKVYLDRGQTRNAETCTSMLAKLDQYGHFASDSQRAYATDLARRAATLPVRLPPTKPRGTVPMPNTFDAMQRLSKITFESIELVRRNQDSLCWIKHPSYEGVIGVLKDGVAELHQAKIARAELSLPGLMRALREIEADPVEAAKRYGKLSGRCSCCGRDLTDPASIEIGVGPICLTRLAG